MRNLKIYIILTLFISSFLFSQNKIKETELFCVEGDSSYYLYYKIDFHNKVEILFKYDFCEMINNKINNENIELKSDFYLILNNDSINLQLKNNYTTLLPISIIKFKKIKQKYIIVFNLISHIGLSGYAYLYLDLKDEKIIVYEYTSKTKLSRNKILRIFKKITR